MIDGVCTWEIKDLIKKMQCGIYVTEHKTQRQMYRLNFITLLNEIRVSPDMKHYCNTDNTWKREYSQLVECTGHFPHYYYYD